MEFTIENECLYKAILDVSKAVSVKTSFPILSGIKIMATDHSLVLVGSNSDLFIEKMIPRVIDGKQVLQVFEQGSAVISAKYLSNLVRKLPGKIHIKVNKQTATIRSGEIVTRLNGLNSEEYPKTPLVDEEKCAVIPSSKLIEVIKQTAFAVSKSENRPVLTAVNMTFNENRFSCAATDSHRLALTELTIRSAIDGSFNVPSKSLTELAKLIQHDTGDIKIFITDSCIKFKLPTISMFSRLIEGHFPNIPSLLPKDSKTVITLDTAQLLLGVDRACLFSSEGKKNMIHFEMKDGKRINISSDSSEIGRIEETQSVKKMTGEANLQIALDGRFLIEALKVIDEKEIRLSFDGAMRPVKIEPVHSSYLYLLSPVRSW